MVAVAKLFRDVIDGRQSAADGATALAALYPIPVANGFLYSKPGSTYVANVGPAQVLRGIPAR